MIPSVVARQTRETVLDYLRTTFSLASDEFEQALFSFLDSPRGLFRGPYIDIRLPFRTAAEDSPIPLDIAPGFTPYRHQLRSFQRLYTKNNHQPQPTLITTGTGSGKTECFLYPVLDHCWRQLGKPGVKAILLYPMNALASDQARRLAETIWDDDRLRGKVTAGLFVGGKGQHGSASREHLIDDRSVLRQSPPDILLTNYRMLDFLLLRPEDQALWRHNEEDTLRYLVLDELHTYDGAQGSDVACLIRRLKARLGASPRAVCPVGTSATIGGQDQEASASALIQFAGQVFGDEFFDDSVITEDRKGIVETLGPKINDLSLPTPGAELDPKNASSIDDWIRKQIAIWIPSLDAASASPVDVGNALRTHGFLRQMLRALDGKLLDYDSVDAWLEKREEGWGKHLPRDRALLLDSFVGLVSWARTQVSSGSSPRMEPFLTVQVQLWLRELRHLVQEVGGTPTFDWEDSVAQSTSYWLPMAYCRSCGTAGWATFQREAETKLQSERRDIGRAWLTRERTCRFVALGHGPIKELFTDFLDPTRLDLSAHAPDDGKAGHLPVRVGRDLSEGKPQRFLQRCPDCDADGSDGLSMLASRAPSLLSVAISHLFQTDYNQDKKLLAFTDSVQDASHRSGFFAARTYRFNLRTAMQGVLESSDSDLPLNELAEQLLPWVSARPQGSAAKALATLWPSDLVDHRDYQAFIDSGGTISDSLRQNLRQRLSWEVTMEFGYSARVGRTLERTGCSTAIIDPMAVATAAEKIALELSEGDVLESALAVDTDQVAHFLAGMLQRLRVQGGIHHPQLQGFLANQGKWYFLTKSRQPLLSPFGSQSRMPRFLTDQPPGARMVFQSVAATPDKWTWHRDWAARALGVDRKDHGIPRLYRAALQRLVEQNVVVAIPAKEGSHTAYGLAPEAIRLTRHIAVLACPVCSAEETIPASLTETWRGRRCLRYRCTGSLDQVSEPKSSYYGTRYRSGNVERIFAHEHTGLLERKERERIEDEFKSPTRPDAPNLFVTTPTLEMGVDIGDLSATVLCSVPPTTANYLQRVGRAGRKTGNAMCLTMAESRPHDLYFTASPMLMMRGQVLPPGCFLDAPEMLRRQLIAFAMDQWARQEDELDSIPRKATFVLKDEGAAKFPGRFLEFYRAHQQGLVDRFFEIFGNVVTEDNETRLRAFAGTQNVKAAVRGAFDRLRAEREEYRNMQRRTRDKLQKIEEDPEKFDDPKAEQADQEAAAKLLSRLISELGQQYPLNVLTDAGVLPNYAFPEPGVTLKVVLRQPSDNDGAKAPNITQDYMRSASTAIRELAPWNTFYADGRKHVIQELDLGTRSNPLYSNWRLCADCHHLELIKPGADVAEMCPRCKDSRWGDSGQVRALVKFERVRSMQTALEAAVSDDGDDRSEAHYQVETLIDVGQENFNDARVAESLPFGIELLKDLPLREINFGNTASRRQAPSDFQVAARKIGQDGFQACLDCGRVCEPDKATLTHAPWCVSRPGGKKAVRLKEQIATVMLYREVRSEAIRVLLPVAEVDQQTRILSFQAALELGFRRRFAGDPRHLQVRMQDEPLPQEGRRRFLIVFDTVPGGTGYLSELWHKDHFRDVLVLAQHTLESCGCQQLETPAAGCYQCLYAYQSQYNLQHLSNYEARAMIREILAAWPEMKAVQTLSEVSLDSRLESELERFFLAELKAHAERHNLPWTESVRGGKELWSLTIAGRTWEIHPQRELGPKDGVAIPCRPDFVITAADGAAHALPVAVFCDGLAYHACPTKPEGRISDDVEKRQAILASGTWHIWNVTWKDVIELKDGGRETLLNTPLSTIAPGQLGRILEHCKIPLSPETPRMPAVIQLLAYLAAPDVGAWRALADRAVLQWLAGDQPLSLPATHKLENQLLDEPARFAPGPMQQVEKGGKHLARWHANEWFAALAVCNTEGLTATNLSGLRVYLRIFDEQDGRSSSDFETPWRVFLQTWNMLQFHPGLRTATSEGIAEQAPAAPPVIEPMRAASLMAAEAPDARPALQQEVDEQLWPIVRDLLDAGAEEPKASYELFDGVRVLGMAELAWPQSKVAVLLEDQQLDAAAFAANDWTVCTPNYVELAKALQIDDISAKESNS